MRPTNLVWGELDQLPEPFQASQPLHMWAERLARIPDDREEGRLSRELLIALGSFMEIETSGEESAISRANQLSLASECAHRIWDIIADGDEDLFFDFSVDWYSAFNAWLVKTDPSLEIRKIISGEKFDMDKMTAEESLSGHRLSVRKPLSWVVLDATREPSKVLCRAKVITN